MSLKNLKIDEVEENELDALLVEEMNRDLKRGLSAIVTAIDNNKKDVEIVNAIKVQSSVISHFVDAVKSIPAPEVNVGVNIVPLEKKAEDILRKQDKIIELLNVQIEQSKIKKEWEFSFQREDYTHLIKSPIKAKQIK